MHWCLFLFPAGCQAEFFRHASSRHGVITGPRKPLLVSFLLHAQLPFYTPVHPIPCPDRHHSGVQYKSLDVSLKNMYSFICIYGWDCTKNLTLFFSTCPIFRFICAAVYLSGPLFPSSFHTNGLGATRYPHPSPPPSKLHCSAFSHRAALWP